METDKLSKAAKELGCEHGEQRAGWIITSETSEKLAKTIMEGHEDGDPQVMELCQSPLSSKWVDDPTPMAILDEIANKVDDQHSLRGDVIEEDTEDILDIYENAYQDTFWNNVILGCKRILGV